MEHGQPHIMNYLAHLYLSEPSAGALVGNLVADWVKGKAIRELPPAIQHGIQFHRRVDKFTDWHPVVQRSIGRISAKWGWFSGILIDIWYDHILATDWARWSPEPLRTFIDRVHEKCLTQFPHLPADARVGIQRYIDSDRLFSYSTLEGIDETLRLVSWRIRERNPDQDVRLEKAIDNLLDNKTNLDEDFGEFFPKLVEFTK